MNDIYNSYLSGEERKIAIQEAEVQNIFDKCNMMYEMVELRYEQNVRDAELKVFKESGTYDDLEYLVEEANDEADDKKKGILTRMIEAIKGILKSITDGVKKIFNIDKGDDEEVECDPRIPEYYNKVKDKWSTVASLGKGLLKQAALSGLLKALTDFFTDDAKAILEKPHNIVKKYTVGAMKKIAGFFDTIAKEAGEILNNIASKIDSILGIKTKDENGKEEGIAKHILNKLSSGLSTINKIREKIWGWIKGKFSKNKGEDTNTETPENNGDGSGDGNNGDGNQPANDGNNGGNNNDVKPGDVPDNNGGNNGGNNNGNPPANNNNNGGQQQNSDNKKGGVKDTVKKVADTVTGKNKKKDDQDGQVVTASVFDTLIDDLNNDLITESFHDELEMNDISDAFAQFDI